MNIKTTVEIEVEADWNGIALEIENPESKAIHRGEVFNLHDTLILQNLPRGEYKINITLEKKQQ